MVQQLEVAQFLEKAQSLPVIDVRSPAEFEHAHIPGAVSIPLFDNGERAQVGTRYKQAGKDAAVLLGLDFVGPKLAQFVKQSRKLNPKGNEVLVHCWRGGMRSGSFAWLLNTAGLTVSTLVGGYKAYRNAVLAAFTESRHLIVLGGKTGSGKTDLLHELAALGEQVIDLEALAHHKGSSYGAIGQVAQPSSEQFENALYQQWRHLDPSRRIWLEDESRSIGTCFIPTELWKQMQTAPVALLEVPKEQRIERLVRDYAGIDHQLLMEATERIRRRLGGQQTQQALTALAQHDYARVADLTLTYYDKTYGHNLAQRDQHTIHPFEMDQENLTEMAQQLIEWADRQEKLKNSVHSS